MKDRKYKASPDEYSNLIDTPVYVKKAPDKDVATYQNDLNQCRSESDIKANRMSKVAIGVGSWWMLSGLYVIATASGWLAIAVTAGTMGSIVGGSTILVTTATEDYQSTNHLKMFGR